MVTETGGHHSMKDNKVSMSEKCSEMPPARGLL